MIAPILVVCTTCGIVFDLRMAPKCQGHHLFESGRIVPFKREFCFLCPLGHPGHDSHLWENADRRSPTQEERDLGITFMLPDFDVRTEKEK